MPGRNGYALRSTGFLMMLEKLPRLMRSDCCEGIHLEHAWKAIPCPADVPHMNLCAKGDKAPGENLLVGRVHFNANLSKVISRLQYHLVLKSSHRVQPSIQWRGGILHEDFENKGPSCLRGGYKGVSLANDSRNTLVNTCATNCCPGRQAWCSEPNVVQASMMAKHPLPSVSNSCKECRHVLWSCVSG